MTPEKLRNSILQRAIEGKLVEQRAEEGTGEELYKLIQKEKKKLIKEGKIKKQKALEEIKEEEIPFDIPKNWKWVRLGEIANITAGGTPSRTNPEYWDGDVPWVKIADMNSKYISTTSETISKKGLENSSAKIFSRGTLLYSIFASIGTVCILKIDASTNQAITGINFYGSIDIDYMYYVMLGLKSILLSKARGMAQLNINQTILKNSTIPLPPLAEQKRIVEKIEELMPLIDEYEKNWQRLEELDKKFPEDMKKSLLQEAIKGKLVEQRAEEGTGEELYKLIQKEKKKLIKEGKIKKQKALDEIKEEEIPFDIPKNWKWVRLGEIINFQGGYAFKSSKYVSKSNNQVIRLGNVKQDHLLTDVKSVFISDDLAKETESYRIRKNDILVTMTGTRRKKDYLFVTLVTEKDMSERKLFLNQRVGCFRLLKCVDHKYILRALQSDQIRDIIFEKETGTANQGNLGSEDMQMYIYIPLPPLAEQKRIVEKLEELLPLCDELIKKEE